MPLSTTPTADLIARVRAGLPHLAAALDALDACVMTGPERDGLRLDTDAPDRPVALALVCHALDAHADADTALAPVRQALAAYAAAVDGLPVVIELDQDEETESRRPGAMADRRPAPTPLATLVLGLSRRLNADMALLDDAAADTPDGADGADGADAR